MYYLQNPTATAHSLSFLDNVYIDGDSSVVVCYDFFGTLWHDMSYLFEGIKYCYKILFILPTERRKIKLLFLFHVIKSRKIVHVLKYLQTSKPWAFNFVFKNQMTNYSVQIAVYLYLFWYDPSYKWYSIHSCDCPLVHQCDPPEASTGGHLYVNLSSSFGKESPKITKKTLTMKSPCFFAIISLKAKLLFISIKFIDHIWNWYCKIWNKILYLEILSNHMQFNNFKSKAEYCL